MKTSHKEMFFTLLYVQHFKIVYIKKKPKQELIASHCNNLNVLGTEQLWKMKPLFLKFYNAIIVRKKWEVERIYQDLLVST